MTGESAPYRLPERRPGGIVFGLSVGQVTCLAAGLVAMIVIPARERSTAGLAAGVAVAVLFGVLGFVPVGGRPLHDAATTVVGFLVRRASGRHGWVAPLPVLDRRPGQPVPACLAGLDLWAVDRPDWAGGSQLLAPVGLVADRRLGGLTGVLEIRGDAFSLLDPADRRYRLAAWAQLLSRFALESSPVARLGWTLWSVPEARADGAARHDLRVWLTLDTRRLARRTDGSEAVLAALRALTERGRAAGLAVLPPASPVEVAEAVRTQADPHAAADLPRIRRGLAEHARLASPLAPAHLLPLSLEAQWDAVRIDGAWHRVFWVAQWPSLGLEPGWLDPLLFAAPAVRTVAVVLEPVAPRTSRRRINADTVTIEGQLAMRERHALRVPVGLARAHEQVDQRDAELAAGFAEFAYLGLIDVAAPDRYQLDDACRAVTDLAAQCGITELRPLHGRHDLAWAATLPLGRVPGRPVIGGRL